MSTQKSKILNWPVECRPKTVALSHKQSVPFDLKCCCFFFFKTNAVYILRSWSVMFPLESPLAALLNLEVHSLGNHHCTETFEVMATPSLIFWASQSIDLCACLDHWLPASLLTGHITQPGTGGPRQLSHPSSTLFQCTSLTSSLLFPGHMPAAEGMAR